MTGNPHIIGARPVAYALFIAFSLGTQVACGRTETLFFPDAFEACISHSLVRFKGRIFQP